MKPKQPIFKYIVGLVIVIAVVIGITLIVQGKNAQQDASVYQAPVAKSVTTGSIGSVATGGTPLNCLPGSTTPQVKVMSPNGGETFTAGQQVTVKWSTCNIPANAQVGIVFDGNNGAYAFTVLPSYANHTTVNDGSETVTIPTSVTISGMGQVQIQGLYKARVIYVVNSTLAIDDDSDNFFTINAKCRPGGTPWIQVLSPNGGEAYTIGSSVKIKWATCNYPNPDVDIILRDTTLVSQGFPAGTTGTIIGGNIPANQGSHGFTIPAALQTNPPHVLGKGAVYKIEIGYGAIAPYSVWDQSDNLFTINP